MDHLEQLDLLKAALALAMADGVLTRSEKGVVEGLATRVGIGKASLDAMLEAAEHDASIADNILIKDKVKAHTALELLVAQARIDGEISADERDLLVRIAKSLQISDADFPVIYHAGLRRADDLRKARQK
ncbi:MAG: hypothetical protein IIB57_12795 [Planctomycetes bacterium]|nr:hypothetical protein [Planctomycetota bacterium]